MIDLTHPEQKDRWQVRDPEGDPVPATAVDVEEGWYEVQARHADADERIGAAPSRSARRRLQAQLAPVTLRRFVDFDLHDVLNDLVVARVRR